MEFRKLKSGKSVEASDIEAWRSVDKGPRYLYLMAGVHGDEVEGVYLLQQLFKWLQRQDHLPSIPLLVIPILNVDGYKSATRQNSHGVDLNRNLPSSDWAEVKDLEKKYFGGDLALSEPENKFLVDLFNRYPPYFIFSFHSWKPMINYNGNCLPVAEFISKYNKYPTKDSVGYPTPGSLGTFAPEKYRAPVITFECPTLSRETSLEDIWVDNEKAFTALFKSSMLAPENYLQNYSGPLNP